VQPRHQRRGLHDLPVTVEAITIGGSFFLYSSITAVAWVFFFTCLPETRGRALESMGKLFGMEDTGLTEAENAASSEKAVELPTK
jgi:hypothetical protein